MEDKEPEKPKMRTSTKWAIGVTVVWLGGVAVYIVCNWCKFIAMEPNSLGDFLAGTMSPLALFWLVAGYRQQGEELRLNTEALRAQLRELVLQVESTKVIAESSKEQAKISRDMHNFEVENTALERQAKLLERRSLIRPDIYLNVVQRDGSIWKIEASNIGGDAFGIKIVSDNFHNAIMSDNKTRFTSSRKRAITLSDPKPFQAFFLQITCWDADENTYLFQYVFDDVQNQLVSKVPHQNGLLVEVD
jgi:hypothetical protein